MQFLSYEGRNSVVTTAAWLAFLLKMPPFLLVSSLYCHPLPQIYSRFSFATFHKYSSVSRFVTVHCCFLFIVDLPSFYLQFDDGNIVGAADICSYGLDVDSWSDVPADDRVAVMAGCFDLSSHEFCVFWMHFDEGKQCLQELSWTPSTNQNERLAPFFSWYPALICTFHFLVVTSLISTSSIERNNLYFDILTITFWRQLYKPFVMVLSQRSSVWLATSWVWWKRCVGW